MIHLYHGDGKGKTTAACGLAIRAAGSGMRVLFVQFLKDGKSSEIKALSALPGITILRPELYFGWFKTMTEEQKSELKECCCTMVRKIADAADAYDLIVLDEAAPAYHHGLLDRAVFLDLLTKERNRREIVMTGRRPAPELRELADYITEMKKEKHPFDSGVTARKGIEY
jgi:cob(I)alamin adenosyltransferase